MTQIPWKITPRHHEVLRELCDCGCRKQVAYRLGVCPQAISSVLKTACRRMGVVTDMQAVLAYDRFMRERAQP